jgi:two-component system nitrate/nitrite response regulator NarL
LSAFEIVLISIVSAMPEARRSDRIRVLLADDHRLFGQALEAVLNGDERFQVVGYARDGQEAVELAKKLRPDLTLMDISMPVLDGVEATRELREAIPDARVLMLTGSNLRADIDRARQAGAAAYVTKDRIASELIDAMLEVLRQQ